MRKRVITYSLTYLSGPLVGIDIGCTMDTTEEAEVMHLEALNDMMSNAHQPWISNHGCGSVESHAISKPKV